MKTRQVKLTVGIYFLLILTVALILGSCKSSGHACDAYGDIKWEDNINNPDNGEFITEIAFNEKCAPQEVTQIMFNQRYSH
jgi:hypothetical protein